MNTIVAAAVPAANLFVPNVVSLDTQAHTATFPLHHGSAKGRSVWYVVTDVSDAKVARDIDADYAPDLETLGTVAVQTATRAKNAARFDLTFAGAPDFSPMRSYVPSTTGFPPGSAHPGGVADGAYSPFVRVPQEGVWNAPIVATGDGPFDVSAHTNTEDRVVAIDTHAMTVTLVLARGFINGRPVYYVSTDASDPVAAAVERATFAPRLAKANTSAEIPIGVVAFGPVDAVNAQGLAFLALHTPLSSDATSENAATIGSPFNVLSLVPDIQHRYEKNDYSPLWNVFVVTAPQSKRQTSFGELAPLSKPAGFVVNCPAIAFGDGSGY